MTKPSGSIGIITLSRAIKGLSIRFCGKTVAAAGSRMFLKCSSSASPSEVGVSWLGEFTEWCFFEPKSQGEVIVVAEILPKNFGIVLSDQTVQTNLHASSALEFENFPIRRLECPRTTPDPSSPTLNRNRATRKEWLQPLVTIWIPAVNPAWDIMAGQKARRKYSTMSMKGELL